MGRVAIRLATMLGKHEREGESSPSLGLGFVSRKKGHVQGQEG